MSRPGMLENKLSENFENRLNVWGYQQFKIMDGYYTHMSYSSPGHSNLNTVKHRKVRQQHFGDIMTRSSMIFNGLLMHFLLFSPMY